MMLSKFQITMRLRLIFAFQKCQFSFGINPRRNQVMNGYLTESQWFERRPYEFRSSIAPAVNLIREQPMKVECNNVSYHTWDKYSEVTGIDGKLLEILEKTGHNQMTPIQKHTFDIINRQLFDLLASAETGSGKTIAFLAPIFNQILSRYPAEVMADLKSNGGSSQFPQLLVLAPTRELVEQIRNEAQRLLLFTRLRVVNLIGGVKPFQQIEDMNRGCNAVIATPGRLIDFCQRGLVSLKHCHRLVLDEADRMLDMGFEPQIRRIIDEFDLPNEPSGQRYTSMFSATFPRDVISLAETILRRNYGRIMIGQDAGASESRIPDSIEQKFVRTSTGDMFRDCFEYLKSSNKKSIVFCNRKSEVDMFHRFAAAQRLRVAVLHGDLSQQRRSMEFQSFKRNETKILAATAIAARGIDVSDVECVVNLGLPTNVEDYTHRVGRCGRMGRPGEAVSFVTDEDISAGVSEDIVKMLRRTKKSVPEFMMQAVSSNKAVQRSSYGYNNNNSYRISSNRSQFQSNRGGYNNQKYNNNDRYSSNKPQYQSNRGTYSNNNYNNNDRYSKKSQFDRDEYDDERESYRDRFMK